MVRFLAIISIACACSLAGAMPPPMPTHVLQGLHVGQKDELIAVHSDGIFKSVDGGDNWKAVLALPPGGSRRFQIVDMGKHGLLASDYLSRTYRSTDNGEHWRANGNGHAISAASGDGAVYGCNSAFEVSKDFGASWAKAPSQPPRMYPAGPKICEAIASAGTMLYVSDTEGGLYASGDGGAHWRTIEPLPASSGQRSGFTADGRGNLFVNTFAQLDGTSYEKRIYLSSDQGRSWKRLGFGVPAEQLLSIEIQAATPTALYMTCSFKDMPYQEQLCISKGDLVSLQAAPLDGAMSVIGAVLRAGPDGRLYALDMYRISSAGADGKNWRRMALKGLPDPYTGKPQ